MKFDYENLVSYITDNLNTAECADYEIEVSDWSVDWSGGTTLDITVEADDATLETLNGHYLHDVYVFTRSELEHVLSDYQPETKEEECITADDVRKGLDGYRVLYESWGKLSECEHDEVIQHILEASSRRKAGY